MVIFKPEYGKDFVMSRVPWRSVWDYY